MEGSGPPFSQELWYAQEALLTVSRTLARLYVTAPYRVLPGVEILEVMRALAEQGNELTRLFSQAEALGQ